MANDNAASETSPDTADAEPLADLIERYRAILDTAVDGIITINDTGIVESFNHAAERIFGYPAAYVIGRNVSLLMPQPYRREHDQYLANYQHTHVARIIGIGREVMGLRRDGSTFPMELAVGEINLKGRKLFTGIVRDITDRREAELLSKRRLHEIAHLSKVVAMGGLASGLAHEVSQPLTAIISHARAGQRMMEASAVDRQAVGESFDHIVRQARRASEVIERIRRFVKRESPALEATQLGGVIEEVLGLLSHEIDAFGIEVSKDFPPGLPPIEVDRVQIEQVIFNLVRNALEAMSEVPEGGRRLAVSLQGMDEDARIRITVRDTGVGLRAEDVGKVFQDFFTTKKHGLGQGLTICRSIVQAHQGDIRLADPDGPGATFVVELPLSQGS
jgi:two-component system, LuxR family, sensor kinase FixL